MKQEDWTKRLHDKMADYEEPAPSDLWAAVEARLQQEAARPAEPAASKRPARILSLWGRRAAVAAAFIGVITCNGYLLWEIGHKEKAHHTHETALIASTAETEKIVNSDKNTPVSSVTETPSIASTAKTEKIVNSDEEPFIPSVSEAPETHETSETPKTQAEAHRQALPSEAEQLRQLDTKIAEYQQQKKKKSRSRIGLNLYAQGGSGNQISGNGVLMSPEMAANYGYHDHLLSRTRAGNGEVIYLANYAEKQKHSQPVSFGLSANIPISSRLSLTTGLVYTRLRSTFTSIMGATALEKEQTLHYIGVPVSLQYQLWQYKGLHVYASAGGQADYNVKAHMEQQGIDYPATRDRWQFSAQAAAGIQYDVIPQLGLYVEPGVKRYFNNGSSVSNYFKDKPTSFNLQIGLRLNIGK